MRAHIEKLCDHIDAAVFSGDQFFEKEARTRLRFFMARWEKELAVRDAAETEEFLRLLTDAKRMAEFGDINADMEDDGVGWKQWYLDVTVALKEVGSG